MSGRAVAFLRELAGYAAWLIGMLALFAMVGAVAGYAFTLTAPPHPDMRLLIQDFNKTNAELRKSSAINRALCQPSRFQRAPYRKAA